MVKRIEDEFSTLATPMRRMLARRKASGLCTRCKAEITERKRTTGKLMTMCRVCLDKQKTSYDKRGAV